jgi:hypothetical protein
MLCACPEELYPKDACDQSKAGLTKANVKWSGATMVKPHRMRDGRCVPIQTLMRRMHLLPCKPPAPLPDRSLAPARVVLRLTQSVGSPGQAFVSAGDRVGEGQVFGDGPEKALGAGVHAAFTGTIAEVTTHPSVLTR